MLWEKARVNAAARRSAATPMIHVLMMRSLVLHPLLFAVFPVLSVYVGNRHELALHELWLPLGVALAAALLVWAGLVVALREPRRPAVLTSAAALLFSSFGWARRALEQPLHRGLSDGEQVALLAAGGLAFALVWLALAHWRELAGALSRPLDVAAGVGVALFGVSFAADDAVAPVAMPASVPQAAAPASARPDIYYIVLDGYGSSETLRRLYGFDNRDFLGTLEATGFYVARRSLANYSQTALSLASSLNLRYLNEFSGRDSTDLRPLAWLIRDSALERELRRYGYAIYAFQTGYPFTNLEGADHYIKPSRGLSDFQNQLFNLTPVPLALRRLAPAGLHDLHRARLLFIFDRLAELGPRPGPKFVFAHIVAPHPPFVFDADGAPRSPARPISFVDGSHFMASGTVEEYVRGYRGQAIFVSRRLEKTLEAILAGSPSPPVVIVQGDHGPGSRLDQDSVAGTDLAERMGILNAYHLPHLSHLPGGAADLLDAEISPVNTFRVVLSQYVGAHYDRLEDRSYFSIRDRPYEFVDVTARLRGVGGRDPGHSFPAGSVPR